MKAIKYIGSLIWDSKKSDYILPNEDNSEFIIKINTNYESNDEDSELLTENNDRNLLQEIDNIEFFTLSDKINEDYNNKKIKFLKNSGYGDYINIVYNNSLEERLLYDIFSSKYFIIEKRDNNTCCYICFNPKSCYCFYYMFCCFIFRCCCFDLKNKTTKVRIIKKNNII